ncbi:MAG: radical SAM protein [Caloramator sp.]|nr:radical SAM protein [Caloramator sp.]
MKAGYVEIYEKGILKEIVEDFKKHYECCMLCPHECRVDRRKQLGYCRATDKVLVSSYGPHFGEESVLVGENGSGTIFFGNCNLRCVYCQNYDISFYAEGKTISNEELGKIMLKIQNVYKCHNINLVTPSHYITNILEALFYAVEKGLNIPIVYNCGGYEKVEILKKLEGIIDIYMPDFKYLDDERALKYSKVKNYGQIAKEAIKEMDRQVGGIRINEEGIAVKGLLIRHLVLTEGLEDTKSILKFIKEELSEDVLVNIMDQYYPSFKAFDYKEISRRLSSSEYKEAIDFALKLGIKIY